MVRPSKAEQELAPVSIEGPGPATDNANAAPMVPSSMRELNETASILRQMRGVTDGVGAAALVNAAVCGSGDNGFITFGADKSHKSDKPKTPIGLEDLGSATGKSDRYVSKERPEPGSGHPPVNGKIEDSSTKLDVNGKKQADVDGKGAAGRETEKKFENGKIDANGKRKDDGSADGQVIEKKFENGKPDSEGKHKDDGGAHGKLTEKKFDNGKQDLDNQSKDGRGVHAKDGEKSISSEKWRLENKNNDDRGTPPAQEKLKKDERNTKVDETSGQAQDRKGRNEIPAGSKESVVDHHNHDIDDMDEAGEPDEGNEPDEDEYI